MVEVLVEHDYVAKECDELTIKKGDIIKNVVKKQGGWWEGVLNEKKGLFPDNFVKIVNSDVKSEIKHKFDTHQPKLCRVLFNYNQDHEDELNLVVGDVIMIIGQEEEGWWRGILNGNEGVFPSNFVEVIQPSNKYTADISPKENGLICIVKYPYASKNEDELTLKEGEIITVINTKLADSGWWKGELNGKIGVFPDNFVEIINENDYTKSSNQAKKSHCSVASDRKSLQIGKQSAQNKKPLPIKKNATSDLKDITVNKVDGPSNSKLCVLYKNEENNVFDEIERKFLLTDVRATRVKSPGRKPTSISNLQKLKSKYCVEDIPQMQPDSENQKTVTELKPKVREWVRNKAPWLSEMKQHQAKKPSSSEISKFNMIATNNHTLDLKSTNNNILENQDETEINTASKKPDLHMRNTVLISNTDYFNLQERINKLEEDIKNQEVIHTQAIEDLQEKLKLEMEMRIILQEKVDEVMQYVTQVYK